MHRHGPGGLIRLLDRPRLVTRRRVGRGIGRGVGGRVGRHLGGHRRVDVPRRVERPASLLLMLDGVVARCHGRVLLMLRMRRPLLLLLLLLQGRRRGGGPTDLPLRIRPARRQRRDHRQRRRRAGRPRRGGRGRRPLALIVALMLTALVFRMLLRLFRRAVVAGVQAGHGRRRARRCQG